MGRPIQFNSQPAAAGALGSAAPPSSSCALKVVHDRLAAEVDALCDSVTMHTNPVFMPAVPRLPSSAPSRMNVIAAIEGQRSRLDFLARNTLIAHDAFTRMQQLTADLIDSELGLAATQPTVWPQQAAPMTDVPPMPATPMSLSDESSQGSDDDRSPPTAAESSRRSQLSLARVSLAAQADELLSLHRAMLLRVERDYPRAVLPLDAAADHIADNIESEGETLRYLARICRLAADGFDGLERRRQGMLSPELPRGSRSFGRLDGAR